MTVDAAGLWALAASWVIYGLIHSLLASDRVKDRLAARCPHCLRGYRLFYNLLAVALLAVPLWLTYGLAGQPLWQWRGAWGWLADGLALAALAGFVYSLRFYDGLGFLGLRQLGADQPARAESESLCLSPLHRWVRHPWYSLALVVLWTRDMNAPWLVSALVITGYFVVGSRLEERKLLRQFGEAYARYRAAVPGLLPRPWRHLTRAQADELELMAGG